MRVRLSLTGLNGIHVPGWTPAFFNRQPGRASGATVAAVLPAVAVRRSVPRRAALGLAAGLATTAGLAGLVWHHRAGAPAARHPAPAVVPQGRLPAIEPTRFVPIAAADARVVNAALPLARSPGPAAAPFVPIADVGNAARAADCLASAAFFEAGDDAEGERAVAQVVLNRVHHPAFPKTVCGVVFQGSERQTGCQFTFTCDGSMRRRTPSPAAWKRARAIADAALGGAVYAPVGLATHYHADWVVPYWSAKLDKIAEVGAHIFYRWAGWWGTPTAFRGRESGVEAGLMGGRLPDSQSGNMTTTLLADGTLKVRGSDRQTPSAASDPDLFLVRLDGKGDGFLSHARSLCGERARCTVLGWTRARLVARSLPLSPEQMDGLSFRYVRNTGDGPARAWWDCAQLPRRNRAECLPSSLLFAAPEVEGVAPALTDGA